MANPSLLLLPPQLFLCKHFDRMRCPSPTSEGPKPPKAVNDQNHRQPQQLSLGFSSHEKWPDPKPPRSRGLRISHLAMEGLKEWQEGMENQMDDPEEMKVLFTALDSFV